MRKSFLFALSMCIGFVLTAQVQYVDVEPDVLINDEMEMGYPLNIFTSSSDDAEFYIQNYYPFPSFFACFGNNAGVVTHGEDFVSRLQENTSIGSASSFTAAVNGGLAFPIIQQEDVYTEWENQVGYVGIKVEHQGNVHYGWVKLGMNADNTFTLYEYAYQASPNTSIVAGDRGASALSDVSKTSFSFYPNPAKDVLNLDLNGSFESVAIYDMLGKQVLFVKPDSDTQSLDLSSLTEGVYVISAVSNRKTLTEKLIVE